MTPHHAHKATCCSAEGLPPDQSARCRLLKAASEVFARKGYAATSVREIVEHAGVTKPVLYYHFGNKEGLLLAIVEEAFKVVAAEIAEAAASPGSVRERTLRVCEAVGELARAHRTEHQVAHFVYFSAADSLPKVDLTRFHASVISQVEDLIRAGIASGEIRPVNPTEAALVLLGIVAVSTHDMDLGPGNQLGSTDVSGLHAIVFDGLSQVP
jgi:TetR/AcrR family transcriptional regulator